MAQDKAAEIIDFTAPRGAAANNGGETTGAFLASSRLSAGFTLEDVSEATKVKLAHLQAIEDMRPDLLPPLPYTSGFVKAYARYLRLDADAVAARFREEVAAAAPAAPEPARAAQELPSIGEGARLASIFAIVAILLFGVWVMVHILGGGGREAGPDPAPRVRLSDSPAVQPTPRPTRGAEPDEASEAQVPPAPEEAAPAAVENRPSTDETAPAADTAERPAAEETAPAASETAGEAATPEETPVEDAAAEAEVQEQPRFLPRRPTTSSPSTPTPPAPSPAPPVVVEATLVRSPAPAYPERCARGAAAVESVSLLFDVDRRGRVTNTRVTSSTNNCFEDEALRTISAWRFEPRTVDGAPAVDAGKSATLNFRR